MLSTCSLIEPQRLYAEARRVATVITDEGGAVFGVVVRDDPRTRHLDPFSLAAAKLADHERLDMPFACDWLRNMSRVEVGAFRWVPRYDALGLRPHIEPAEPGSRGSWFGMQWSYP